MIDKLNYEGGYYVILQEKYNSFYNHYIKRFLDVVISLSGLIILSPILIIIAFIQLVETGLPIFYRAERDINIKTLNLN